MIDVSNGDLFTCDMGNGAIAADLTLISIDARDKLATQNLPITKVSRLNYGGAIIQGRRFQKRPFASAKPRTRTKNAETTAHVPPKLL